MSGRRALQLAAVAGLSGCTGQSLEGSMTELLNLTYKNATILITDNGTSVKFTVPRGTGEDVVLNVFASVADLQLVAHGDIDLAEQIETGGQRGVVTRNVLNDPHRTFPAIDRGNLRYESVPTPGFTIPGSFSVTFKECTDFGCGRTVFGTFTAQVPKP